MDDPALSAVEMSAFNFSAAPSQRPTRARKPKSVIVESEVRRSARLSALCDGFRHSTPAKFPMKKPAAKLRRSARLLWMANYHGLLLMMQINLLCRHPRQSMCCSRLAFASALGRRSSLRRILRLLLASLLLLLVPMIADRFIWWGLWLTLVKTIYLHLSFRLCLNFYAIPWLNWYCHYVVVFCCYFIMVCNESV